MSFSLILPLALFAGSLTTPAAAPTAPAPPGLVGTPVATHNLRLSTTDGGCLVVDGEALGGTLTLALDRPHIGSRNTVGGDYQSVSLPDGRVFYKGDFTLVIQTHTGNTLELIEVEICDGEALVSELPQPAAPPARA